MAWGLQSPIRMVRGLGSTIAVTLLGALVLGGCAAAPGATGDGCANDADCKGDRVCDPERKLCVDPNGSSGAADDPTRRDAGAAEDRRDAGARPDAASGAAGRGGAGAGAGGAGRGGAGGAGVPGGAGNAGGAGVGAGGLGGGAMLPDAAAPPDAAPLPPDAPPAPMCQPSAGPCNEVSSAGCGPLQKCTIGDPMNPTRCACGGPAGTGQACTVTLDGDTCAAGNVCLIDDRCHKYCRADADCAGFGACIVSLIHASGLDSGLKVCSGAPDACDPTSTTAGAPCPAGQGCYLLGGAAGTRCLEAGTTGVGGSCQSSTQCAPGNLCISVNNGQAGCLPVCDLQNPRCPGGRTCRELVGGGRYGACI